MNLLSSHSGRGAAAFFAVLLLACPAARADFRVQLTRDAPLLARADASAQSAGSSRAGDILFAKALSGNFYAVSAPESARVWLSRDLVENNKIAARSALVRTGPGIACERVGELPRGTRVMALAEDGDWCQIAAPSTLTVYVDASAAVQLSTGDAAAEPAAPEAVAPVAPPPPPAAVPAVPPAPAPQVASPAPAPAKPASPPPPAARPESPAKPAPVPAAPAAAQPTQPPAHVRRPLATQPLRRPDGSAMPVAQPQPAPARAPVAAPPAIVPSRVSGNPPTVSASRPGIAPVAPATSAKAPAPLPPLRRDWLEDLSLADVEGQGKAVRIRGELRTDPLHPYAPYRLLRRDEKTVEAVCSVKGDSAVLRTLVGKRVVIRGYRYFVRQSSLPVIVVGDIAAGEDLP